MYKTWHVHVDVNCQQICKISRNKT